MTQGSDEKVGSSTREIGASRDAIVESFSAVDQDGSGRLHRNVIIEVFCKLGWQREQGMALLNAYGNEPEVDYKSFLHWICDFVPQEAIPKGLCLESPADSGSRNPIMVGRRPSRMGSTDTSLKSLSLHFLSTVFPEEIRTAGFDYSRASVIDIAQSVIYQKGKGVICPRDRQMGAAYVDAVDDSPDNVGEATHMLSYTWGYCVSDIVAALASFCRSQGLDSKCFYIWMCCTCVNQHRVTPAEPLSFEFFEGVFRERVVRIGHVLALMMPWRDPGYIKRVWTCFELYTAVMNNDKVKLDIVLPTKEDEDLKRSIILSDGLDPMWKALKTLKVEEAQAWSPDDRENIFKLIKNGPGFAKLNRIVAEHIRNWILDTVEAHVESVFAQYESASIPDASLTWPIVSDYGEALGDMLRRFGQPSRARSVYAKTKKLAKKKDHLTEDYAKLLKKEGSSRTAQGEFAGALVLFTEALDILNGIGKANSKGVASLLNYVASAKLHLGDLESAIDANEKSKRILSDLGQLQTGNGAYMLREYGDMLLQNIDLDGALQQFQEAMDIYKKLDKVGTPDYAYLLNSQAQVDLRRSDLHGAIGKFNAARDIHRKMGTLGTNGGLHLLVNKAKAEMTAGDLTCAQKTLEEARALHQENGTLETKGANVVSLLTDLEAKRLQVMI